MATDIYSKSVSVFKVLLPLFALALLSTLFFLSDVIEPNQNVPFAEPEIRKRLLNQQVTEPYYSGMSADGDEITFVAATVTTSDALDGAKNATDVEAQFKMLSGTIIDLTSDTGFFDLARDYTSLTGQVVVSTSRGYILRSNQFYGKLSMIDLRSPDRVTGNMPGGDLTAGSMILTAPEENGPLQLLFNDGVRLIYDPKRVKE